MKKLLSILLAVALAFACVGCVAEGEAVSKEIIDALTDVWLSESDEAAAALEIWYDAGAFHCSANRTLDDVGDEDYRWEFGSCRYDAGSNSLICEEGVRTHNLFDEEALVLNTDETVTGVSATIAVVEGDKLVWKDSEGLMDGVAFLHLSVVEDMMGESYTPDPKSLAFEGAWVCGRASMDISAEDAGYKVSITWGGSAWESAQWEYACMYNAEAGTLVDSGMGSKCIVTYGDDGQLESVEEQYSDGKAEFAIDGAGHLTWKDAVENAGEGMAFERVANDESEDSAGIGNTINCFIDENGHYIIQIPVAADDAGEWRADDMSQDDTVVKLYFADTLEDTFVANYEPAGDGVVTIGVRHFTGIACDEVYTWDLAVLEGKVVEASGGSWSTSPDAADLDVYVSGQWTEREKGLHAMTISRNPDRGWDAEIVVAAGRTPCVYRIALFYDCEKNSFVYEDGQVFETQISDSDAENLGELLRGDATGSMEFVEGDDGLIRLMWRDGADDGEGVLFERTGT